MRSLPVRVTLGYRGDAGVCWTVTDQKSGVVILEMEMTPDELVRLQSSAAVETDATVPPTEQLTKIGCLREHEEHIPDPRVLAVTTGDEPTADMIFYGDSYRERYGWDTATWHKHSSGRWCLHLVRWV